MTDEATGLAAVHAAATNPALNHTAAAALAAQRPATRVELMAAFPEICAEIRAEGATAERTRILAIEANALAGHEALVAAMKADPSCTADMAAGRLLNAEKQLRAGQLAAVRDVESVTGAVAAAPAAVTRTSDAKTDPAAAAAASTPDGWRAEWEASKDLQAEFSKVDHYVAFKKADAAGQVRILKK